MFQRWLILIFGVMVVFFSYANSSVASLPPTKKIIPLAAFNQVEIKGILNVRLHTGSSRSKIIAKGDVRDLSQLQIRVVNNFLSVNLGSGFPQNGSVFVDLYTQNLNYFFYKGVGVISGNNLCSNVLDLIIDNPGSTILKGKLFLGKLVLKGSGVVNLEGMRSKNLSLRLDGATHVQMSGMIELANINLKDNANLNLYWLDTQGLRVRARDKSQVNLAGVAGKLDVELWNHALFAGCHLRARESFVKTHDEAIAKIVALRSQHTLAADNSDIYFYNIPEFRTDFMSNNGAVLDLRTLGCATVQEYDRYNK